MEELDSIKCNFTETIQTDNRNTDSVSLATDHLKVNCPYEPIQ